MSDIKKLRDDLHNGKLTRREIIRAGGLLGLGSMAFGLAACAPAADSGKTGSEPKADEVVAPAAKKFRAAYSSVGLAASWVAQGADTMKFIGDLIGIEWKVYDPAFSVDQQRKDIEDIASQDWDFVAIHPLAIEAYVDPVKKLISRKIPVIDIDTKLTDDLSTLDIVTFIEPDNVWMGEQVTTQLMQAINFKGKVVHTQGALTHTGAQGRAKGFHNIVDQYPDVEVVDETPADWDVDKTRKIWEDLLVKYPDIVAGFCHNDDMALAAYGAVKAAGKEKQIYIGGVDGMPPALQAVIDGTLTATAVNPTGRIHGGATWVGYNVVTGKTPAANVPKFIRADGPLVTPKLAPGLLYLSKNLLI